jgi:hypothetical protein
MNCVRCGRSPEACLCPKITDRAPAMSSTDYNRIVQARMFYNLAIEEGLQACGWHKGWRKKNNLHYWIKDIPGEGIVTALTGEEALRWEYEL